MIIAEDDPEDTTKPRLMAAGADLTRVHLLRCVRITQGANKAERMLALDTDLKLLEAELVANPAIKLVVIDPITTYFGKANVNRDQELRTVLGNRPANLIVLFKHPQRFVENSLLNCYQ